jgi:4-hydroxy-tetrahydrodipicolinate synthase
LPVIIYNIPLRSGVNIDNQIVYRLYDDVENIIGIKDAGGNIIQTMELIKYVRGKAKKFYVFSGEDLLTYPMLALGSDGVICASAHIAGKEYSEMCQHALNGDLLKAREIHYKVIDITKALFSEPNPIAIKACLKLKGIDVGNVRPPLYPAKESTYELLKKYC